MGRLRAQRTGENIETRLTAQSKKQPPWLYRPHRVLAPRQAQSSPLRDIVNGEPYGRSDRQRHEESQDVWAVWPIVTQLFTWRRMREWSGIRTSAVSANERFARCREQGSEQRKAAHTGLTVVNHTLSLLLWHLTLLRFSGI
jgi:hypothetical protein